MVKQGQGLADPGQGLADPGASPFRPGSSGSPEQLWRAFIRSVRDNVMAELIVQAFRLGGMIFLARALSPGEFGVFRVLLVVTMLGALVGEAGIPDALIQRKEIRPEHEATAWWLNLSFAAAVSAALYFGASTVARWMDMPELASGVRLCCLPLLFEGTALLATARLRRRLEFTALAAADVVSEAAFLLAAFSTLWTGHSRWSLSAGLAARFSAHALVLWILDPVLPTTLPRLSAARDLVRFSASVLGGRLVTLASSNADYLLVGKLLGEGALGYYGMAWDLLRFVPDRLYKVAGRVTFPAFCRLQDDNPALSHAYSQFFDYMSRVIVPIAACVAVGAPELLATVYGPQWLPAAAPLRLLTPGLALAGLRSSIGSIFYCKNYPAMDIYLNGARLALLIVTVLSLAHLGLGAVSAGMSAMEGSISIAGQGLVCWLIGLGGWDLFLAGVPGLRVAGMCMLAASIGKAIVFITGISQPWSLAVIALPPAAAYAWVEFPTALDMFSKAFGQVQASTAETN